MRRDRESINSWLNIDNLVILLLVVNYLKYSCVSVVVIIIIIMPIVKEIMVLLLSSVVVLINVRGWYLR